MKHRKVAKYWNKNAKYWIKTSELGFDVWRDHLNTTAFLNMLPISLIYLAWRLAVVKDITRA